MMFLREGDKVCFKAISLSRDLPSMNMEVSSVWFITNERASYPKLSKKGMMVIALLRQARSMVAHCSEFLPKIPRKLKSMPSSWFYEERPRWLIPMI